MNIDNGLENREKWSAGVYSSDHFVCLHRKDFLVTFTSVLLCTRGNAL